MIIYFDTEFTNIFGPARLISAGFVAEDGQEFYFELTDNYKNNDCSYFVLENVLPYLNISEHGMSSVQAVLKLKAWCESFSEPVQFASDAPAYDFGLLSSLLREQKVSIENADTECLRVDEVEDKIERYFEYQPLAIRHHALWDARALASAFRT